MQLEMHTCQVGCLCLAAYRAIKKQLATVSECWISLKVLCDLPTDSLGILSGALDQASIAPFGLPVANSP